MVYKLDLQYVYQGEYWTNVFYLQTSSQQAAYNAVFEIADALKPGLQDSVTIDKGRITPAPFARDTFTDVPLAIVGTGGSTQPAPLFNVVRWQWGRGIGRSISHYFRGGVTPSNIGSNQQFTSAAQAFNTQLVQSLSQLEVPFCNRQGVQYVQFQASPRVGMRQLRRGSKRRTSPVI